ncbi:MAG: GNAT family N-acetyltransferase [Chitinivibrionales bacterium]|nr:GNAT family N-acetyltransferase [Chitinivibrionales bacterium]
MPCTGTIITSRLRITPVDNKDIIELHRLWTGQHIRRFLFDNRKVSRSRTRELIAVNLELFRENGYGIWGFRRLRARDLVGIVGYWHFRIPPKLELLYAVDEHYRGKGFATEAAAAIRDYSFAELAFKELNASVDSLNTSSVNVLHKLGMRVRNRSRCKGRTVCSYRLGKRSWSHYHLNT